MQFVLGFYWALTLGFFSALGFAIWKLFQIGRDVSEIEAMLIHISRNDALHR